MRTLVNLNFSIDGKNKAGRVIGEVVVAMGRHARSDLGEQFGGACAWPLPY